MVARMTEAWKIDLEGLMVVHEMRSSRRPWVQIDKRGLHALKPNMARKCFRSHRRSREIGGTGDTGPSNDILVPDQSIQRHGLLAPTLPQKPSGSCHHVESRWASSIHLAIVTTQDKGGDAVTRKKKKRGRTNNMQSVSMRVQAVAEQHVSSQTVR